MTDAPTPIEERITTVEARIAALEVGQSSAVAAERERCARHVGSLLDSMVMERSVAYPVGEMVRALRAIEQAIRNGDVNTLVWEMGRSR